MARYGPKPRRSEKQINKQKQYPKAADSTVPFKLLTLTRYSGKNTILSTTELNRVGVSIEHCQLDLPELKQVKIRKQNLIRATN